MSVHAVNKYFEFILQILQIFKHKKIYLFLVGQRSKELSKVIKKDLTAQRVKLQQARDNLQGSIDTFEDCACSPFWKY